MIFLPLSASFPLSPKINLKKSHTHLFETINIKLCIKAELLPSPVSKPTTCRCHPIPAFPLTAACGGPSHSPLLATLSPRCTCKGRRGDCLGFAEVEPDYTRDSAARFISLHEKPWASLPVSRAQEAFGLALAGQEAFSFIAPTRGMEVQRPLEISKFGQSVGGGAGCAHAKNSSSGLGWKPHPPQQARWASPCGSASASTPFTQPLESPASSLPPQHHCPGPEPHPW